MALVRTDRFGIYVLAGGYIARPGGVGGYEHANKMDDGAAQIGTKIKAKHIAGTPLTKIETPDGVRYWHHYGQNDDPKAFQESRRPKPGAKEQMLSLLGRAVKHPSDKSISSSSGDAA